VAITGASQGIGLATAHCFAEAGAHLAIGARSIDKLRQLADELTAKGVNAFAACVDMRAKDQVQAFIGQTHQRFGKIDILINNAGQSAAGSIAEGNTDHYLQIIELNMLGPLYAMQAAIPLMRRAGGGMIINISSMVSRMQLPGLALYASTKAALNKLSDTARVELAVDNIKVITVYPRLTATDFAKNALGAAEHQRIRQQAGSRWQNPMVPDSAEFVAKKILETAQKEPDEQFME
jgi:short-subunit dehydrogenase